MIRLNLQVSRYKERDSACHICESALGIPNVLCLDMDTAEAYPVPLVSAFKYLWLYVRCDDLCDCHQAFLSKPMRLCKAVISLISSRIYYSQG